MKTLTARPTNELTGIETDGYGKEGIYCIPRNGERLLLVRMKLGRWHRGTDWHGLIGWKSENETLEQCSQRVCLEKAGLRISSLREVGVVRVFARGQKIEPDRLFHIVIADSLDGAIVESEERRFSGRVWDLHWFPTSRLPLHQLSIMDEYWFPYLFASRRFEMDFFWKGPYEDLEEMVGFRVSIT